MKIEKIATEGTCCECGNAHAELSVTLGRNIPQLLLCKECAWNLSELLDKTTAIDFQEAVYQKGEE